MEPKPCPHPRDKRGPWVDDAGEVNGERCTVCGMVRRRLDMGADNIPHLGMWEILVPMRPHTP